MSRYGYLDVFKRVIWNSRSRESTVFLLQCKRTGILNFTESTPTYLYADINTEQIIYDCNPHAKSTADLYFLAQG